MRLPGLVLGFHGCDRAVADRILNGREEVRVSDNSHDWLGSGAYFWENNPSRALSWAEFLASKPSSGRGNIKTPAVIGAIIHPGYCLDLTAEASLGLVREASEGYIRFCEEAALPIPVNEPGFPGDEDFVKRQLDCAVINFLHRSRAALGLQEFDTVRAPFLEGGELFAGSRLSAKSHVQWSVRDPKRSIIGYFRPRDPKATTA